MSGHSEPIAIGFISAFDVQTLERVQDDCICQGKA